MEIFRILKPKQKKQFVSEIDFSTNRGRQSHLAIQTLVRLREVNVEEEDELKIDYIFFTDTFEKAQSLTKALQNLGYIVDGKMSASDKKVHTIKGQTTHIRMMHEVLRKWAIEMCELGYEYDCNFEEWEITTT